MTMQTATERRTRAAAPFLSLAVAVAVVAGFAIGAQVLRSASNAGAVAAAPAQTAAANGANSPGTGRSSTNGVNPLSLPAPTSDESAQDCTAFDARSYAPFCGDSARTRIEPPRAAWQACAVMDATTYRQLCHQGEGGRWIQGARAPGQ